MENLTNTYSEMSQCLVIMGMLFPRFWAVESWVMPTCLCGTRSVHSIWGRSTPFNSVKNMSSGLQITYSKSLFPRKSDFSFYLALCCLLTRGEYFLGVGQNFNYIIKYFCPGWHSSVDWAWACEPKGHRFYSQSGHTPGLWAMSPVGDSWGATTHWCFSPSLSLSLPLSLKINK